MQDQAVAANGRIQRTSPIDLHELPVFRASSDDEVRSAVRKAGVAQRAWGEQSFGARAALLKKAAKQMLARRQEAVELILEELGKHSAEVLMTEALGPLDCASQWIGVVGRELKPYRPAVSPLAFPGKKVTVDMLPRGVVGVVAPWNFPLAYFFKAVFPPLLCGNAVVIKPSEYAPGTADWFVRVLSETLPRDVVQCVQGDGATGRALIKSGIDALTFTGSVATGREVLKLAAEQMIPCSVELGGKDPAIVLPDCDLDRTIAGIMYWGYSNAGQSCGAIERVYVLEDFADRFVEQLAAAVRNLRAGPEPDGMVDVGPIVSDKQLAIIENHVTDAVRKGAKLLCGGKRSGKGRWFAPTVLDHCDHTMKVVTEETFGPVLAVIRVRDVDEAVKLANDSVYGLNASVWSSDLARAEQIARRLEAGTVLVNNHAVTGAMASVPWTGVKQTGFGVANSKFALSTFVRPRSVVIDSNRKPEMWWFPMDGILADLGDRLGDAQLGRVWKALTVPLLMNRRVRAVLEFARGGTPAATKSTAEPYPAAGSA